MKNLYSKSGGQALTKTAITPLCLYFLFCMIIFPQRFIKSGLNGISAWAFNVLPSVLPFMFFEIVRFSYQSSAQPEGLDSASQQIVPTRFVKQNALLSMIETFLGIMIVEIFTQVN